MKISRTWLIILIVLLVLIIDQWLKMYIKTNFWIGREVSILGSGKAFLRFVENPGMAFGIQLGEGEQGKIYGKYALSIFRIVAVFFLIYIIKSLIKAKSKKGLLVCFALILAGAIGNILDSCFYGLIFSQSSIHSGHVAEFFPEGGGYAPFLQGNVVDMFYFPLVNTTLPEWLGGGRFQFFRPIFNVADAAISTGVISLLLFYRSFFLSKGDEEKGPEDKEESEHKDEEE